MYIRSLDAAVIARAAPPGIAVCLKTWSMCNRVKCDGITNLRLEGNATNRVEQICCLASFHAYGNWNLESQSPAVYIGLDFMSLGFMVSKSSLR